MTVELSKRQMNAQTVSFESVLKMDHVVRMDMILQPMGSALTSLNQEALCIRFERELKWFGEAAEYLRSQQLYSEAALFQGFL